MAHAASSTRERDFSNALDLFFCSFLSTRFTGNFHSDMFHGEGKHAYPNSDTCEGTWLKGKRHGAGVLKFRDTKKPEVKQVWDQDTLIKEIRPKVTSSVQGGSCHCNIA